MKQRLPRSCQVECREDSPPRSGRESREVRLDRHRKARVLGGGD